ncbi:MAG: hypothetical protein IPK75_12645 [Acidobacteria bacterium]|nr:hypothetical protein [Acidobacteriota bacterium]
MTKTPATRKMKIWNRPPLPNAQGGSGIAVAWLSLLVACVLITWAIADPYAGPIPLWLGAGLVQVSLIVFAVTPILREIRHLAYDMARRAGEVEEREVPRYAPL